jgi:hypothetical protein
MSFAARWYKGVRLVARSLQGRCCRTGASCTVQPSLLPAGSKGKQHIVSSQ